MKQLPTVGTLSSEILSFSSINQNFDSTAPSAKRPRTTASKSTKGKKGKGKGKKGKENNIHSTIEIPYHHFSYHFYTTYL